MFIHLLCLLIMMSLSAAEQKPFYIIEGSNRDQCSILYILNTALSLLDQYEKDEINGFEISYNNDGLYFDLQRGSNWWLYYFEPLKVMHEHPHTTTRLPNYLKFIKGTEALFEMSRERKHALIQKYICVNTKMQEEVARIVQHDFHNAYIIGVDYFSSEKPIYNPQVTFEQITATIKNVMHKLTLEQSHKVFLATNDEPFLTQMQKEFPNAIVCLGVMARGQTTAADGYAWLLNTLTLSRANILVSTGALVGRMAAAFNNSLELIQLDKHWAEKD